jgi:uncharacterized protein (DUF697 family)
MTTTDALPKRTTIQKIIQHHMYASMGVGMIPVPLVDLIAISSVQLNMVRKLCLVYDIPFSRDAAKTGIAALLGGVIPVSLSGALASLVKAIPIVGHTTSAIVMPAVSGAMTYAVGKVFVQHFESGGTFLTFKPDEVRAYYQQMFEEGKNVASEEEAAPEAEAAAEAEAAETKDRGAPAAEKEDTAKAEAKKQQTKPEAKPKTTPSKKAAGPQKATPEPGPASKNDPDI